MTESFEAGQRWAYRNAPGAFSASFQIANADGDLQLVLHVRADLRELYRIKGVRVTVSEAVLQRSVTELLAAESQLPDWADEDYDRDDDDDLRVAQPLYGTQNYGDLAKILGRIWKRLHNLTFAIESGLVQLARLLLAEDPESVHRPTPNGSTALHAAAARRSPELVALLLEAGASPNARDESGATPLHTAANSNDNGGGEDAVIRLLLDAGAAPLLRDSSGRTPMNIAVSCENRAAVSQFLQRGAAASLEALLLLGRVDAAHALLTRDAGSLARVAEPEKLLNLLLDPEPVDTATAEQVLALARVLLEHGVPATFWQLRNAVASNRKELVRLLLERGVNPNEWLDNGHYLPEATLDTEMQSLVRQFGALASDDPAAIARREAREARERAESPASESIPEDQLSAEGYRDRARLWFDLGQYERALADLQAALVLEPGSVEALNLRAWILSTCPDERFRNGAEAVTLARRVVRLAGNNLYMNTDGGTIELFFRTDFHNTLAAALAESGDFDAARTTLKIAEVRCRRAEYREMLQRLSDSFSDSRPYRDLPPGDVDRLRGQQLAAQTPRVDPARIRVPVVVDDRSIRVYGDSVNVPAGLFDLARAEELLALPGLADTVYLTIEGSRFDEASAQRLADGLRCPKMTVFTLSRSELPDRVGVILLGGGNWPSVETLKAQEIKLGNAGLIALAHATWPERLVHLDIGFNRIRVEGIRALASAPWLERLQTLECWCNRLRTEGVCLLAASPHLTALTNLTLGSNRLGAAAGAALAAAVMPALRELDLRSNRLGDAGAAGLGQPTQLRPTKLLLSTNRIGPAGLAALARGPILERVRELDLKQNPLGAAGMRALVASPHLSALRTLSLDTTLLDPEAARILADAPGLDQLQRLTVDEQEVGDDGAERLVDRFEDRVTIHSTPYYSSRSVEGVV